MIGLFYPMGSYLPVSNKMIVDTSYNSLFFLAHPNTHYIWGGNYDDQYYINTFMELHSKGLIGIEIYNHLSYKSGHLTWNGVNNNLMLWDKLLQELSLQDIIIYGFSTDDFHYGINDYLGYGYVSIVTDESPSRSSIYESLVNGSFFSVISYRHSSIKPILKRVYINKYSQEIEIEFNVQGTINWISGIKDGDSDIVHTGSVFSFRDFDKKYVRVEFATDDYIVYLQPFLFKLINK